MRGRVGEGIAGFCDNASICSACGSDIPSSSQSNWNLNRTDKEKRLDRLPNHPLRLFVVLGVSHNRLALRQKVSNEEARGKKVF